MNLNAKSITASIDSIQSTLRLPGTDQSFDEDEIKFSISISFLDYRNFSNFCKSYVENEEGDGKRLGSLPTRTFWLSWVLFDKSFQSEEFSADDSDMQKVRDIIRVRCSRGSMRKAATSDSSLRVFLCTQGNVLAAGGMPLHQQNTNQSDIKFPFDSILWQNLQMSQSLPSSLKTEYNLKRPAIKVSINVSIETENEIVGAINSGSSASRIPRRSPPVSPPTLIINPFSTTKHIDIIPINQKNEDEGEEEYVDESFEGENLAKIKSNESSNRVHFSMESDEESDDKKSIKRKMRKSAQKKQQDLCETSSEDAEDSIDEGKEYNLEEDDVDDYTRHYRVNVEVRSIGGLKRATNASIQFTYPFLGKNIKKYIYVVIEINFQIFVSVCHLMIQWPLS